MRSGEPLLVVVQGSFDDPAGVAAPRPALLGGLLWARHRGGGRRVDGGLNVSIRLPGPEVGTVGGGTTLPYAPTWLELMGCAGPGKVYRFAQIVAAATLALEISASAAMSTAGSENFFRAHHERGGLR